MDTGSHLLFGITLGGLSFIDPAVAAQPELAYAIVTATIIGSHAPDMDTVVRLKSQAAYVRHHRGITHSLPAPLVWAAALGVPIAWAFDVLQHSLLIATWTFIAVCFHIFLDLFNAYGVQCLRPFSRKWWHLDTLCLFDPYLFGLHSAGALLWLTGIIHPGSMFVFIYLLTCGYMVWRLYVNVSIRKKLRKQLGESIRITLVPSLWGMNWQFTADCGDCYKAGVVKKGKVHVAATVMKAQDAQAALAPAIQAAITEDGVQAFLSFADRVHVQVQENLDGYEVTWSDVRFWSNNQMPFGVAVTLDRELKVLHHHLGWKKKSWEPPHV